MNLFVSVILNNVSIASSDEYNKNNKILHKLVTIAKHFYQTKTDCDKNSASTIKPITVTTMTAMIVMQNKVHFGGNRFKMTCCIQIASN